MKMMQHKFVFLTSILVLLAACQSKNNIFQSSSTERSCAIVPIAIPVQTTTPSQDTYPVLFPTPQLISPLGDWEEVGTLSGDVYNMVALESQIWIGGNPIRKFDTKNKKWTSYSKIDNFSGYSNQLFISSDDTLWGGNLYFDTGEIALANPPVLSRYNKLTDEFESVIDNDGLFNGLISASIIGEHNKSLWIIGSRKGDKKIFSELYSFDPSAGSAKLHLDSNLQVASIYEPALAPNGDVWFIDQVNKQIMEYSAVTENVKKYSGYPSYEDLKKEGSVYKFYFDRAGRLWIDNTGWLDFTDPNQPAWYKIVDAPEFLTKNTPPYYFGYTFAPATGIFQSTDGRYWFTSQAGIVRLDFEQQNWCLITTGVSPVIEDNQKNLWIAVYGKLYKYALRK